MAYDEINRAKEFLKPEAPPWMFDNIAEASKRASRIYTVFLSVLAYCLITVVGITDRQLLLNEPVRLPLVNVEAKLSVFLALSMITCILIFVYLQLYIHRIKSLTDQLEAHYYCQQEGRLYPWLLNIARKPDHGEVGIWQTRIADLSLWWLLPMVMGIFSLCAVKRHEPWLSSIVIAIGVVGLALTEMFWFHFTSDRERKPLVFRLLFIWSVVLGVSSVTAAFGINAGRVSFLNLDLEREILSTRPTHEYEGHYWRDLGGVHLEGANLRFAVLERANLMWASLHNADLSRAILTKAELSSADLSGAVLKGANLVDATPYFADFSDANLTLADLRGADLTGANLSNAILVDANLSKASLSDSIIMGAFLGGADLTGANLSQSFLLGADLSNSILMGANLSNVKHLSVVQLSEAKTLYNAILDQPLREAIEKDYPHLLEPLMEQPETETSSK